MELFFVLGCPLRKISFLKTLNPNTLSLFVYPVLIFFLLLVNWIVLSGKFDAFHLGLGLISCGVVTWLSQDLLYEDRRKKAKVRLKEAWAFIKYLPWITWEVVKANLHVFKLAMTRRAMRKCHPGW